MRRRRVCSRAVVPVRRAHKANDAAHCVCILQAVHLHLSRHQGVSRLPRRGPALPRAAHTTVTAENCAVASRLCHNASLAGAALVLCYGPNHALNYQVLHCLICASPARIITEKAAEVPSLRRQFCEEGDVPHFPGQQVRHCLERVLHVLWGNEGKKGAALCAHPVSVRALARVPLTCTEHAQNPRHARHGSTWLLLPLDAYSPTSQSRWKRTTRQERLSEV